MTPPPDGRDDRADRLGYAVGSALRGFPLVGLLFAIAFAFPRWRQVSTVFFALFGVICWLHLAVFLWVVQKAKRINGTDRR